MKRSPSKGSVVHMKHSDCIKNIAFLFLHFTQHGAVQRYEDIFSFFFFLKDFRPRWWHPSQYYRQSNGLPLQHGWGERAGPPHEQPLQQHHQQWKPVQPYARVRIWQYRTFLFRMRSQMFWCRDLLCDLESTLTRLLLTWRSLRDDAHTEGWQIQGKNLGKM